MIFLCCNNCIHIESTPIDEECDFYNSTDIYLKLEKLKKVLNINVQQ